MMNYPKLSDSHIGFIGAGNIAFAIVKGFINSGLINAKQISLSAPSNRNLTKFNELGCFTTNDNNLLFSQSNKSKEFAAKIIFLCVKPNIIKDRKTDIFLDCNQLIPYYGPIIVISVLAGTEIKTIRKACGYVSNTILSDDEIKFARLIPNTACSVNTGICGISRDINDPKFDQFLVSLLSPLGLCEIVPESQLNAICGVGGSGIAFVYSMIHAMSDGGLKMGLPRSVSTKFAAQTVLGAASMVLTTEKNPIQLRDEVTSPAGTTIYGLHALERGAFNSLIIDAVESATQRANQLS